MAGLSILAAEEFHDIAPPVDYSLIPPWLVFVIVFVALSLLGLVVWLFAKRRKAAVLPPKSPREIALEELERIGCEIERMSPYQFSIRVSDILRKYVTQQYGLPATRQTSIEFLTTLAKASPFSSEEQSLLEDFLNRCDLIKFARYEATTSDSELLLGEAIHFVKGGIASTKFQPPITREGPNSKSQGPLTPSQGLTLRAWDFSGAWGLVLGAFDWWPANSALTFARPWLLLLLVAIPLLAYLRGKRGPAAALTYSSTATLRAIGKQSAARAGRILRTLLLASLAIFVVALARPQLGKSLTQIEASGIDIMLVLDVSGSMLTKDFTIGGQEATRVDAIREVTRKFIEERPNDRIGIIAFAGRPYVVSPMTLDHDWLLQNLDRVRIGLVEDGTAIGSAMAAAANRLNDKRSKSRVLVLLTDGENNAGKIPPNTAAEAVKALKIHFYAIGAGINGIAPAPIFTNRGPLTDALGNILYENQRVEFNETGLKEVAKIADGKFFRATDTKSLEQIYNDIDKLEKSTVSVKKYQQYRDLFPLCLMGGCGLLVAQILLSQTIWKKLP